MARMRTIEETAAYFKEMDKSTALTKTAIRRLVVSGIIPSVRVGSKYLLNLDSVEAWLSNSMQAVTPQAGGIRRLGA